jgi:hypothetical protein
MSPERLKHLEFIQAVISRLAGNSYLIKSWTVTLVAALFALAAKEAQQKYAIIALLPAVCFWGLDAYYLRQERLFRALYVHAAAEASRVPVFSMDTEPFRKAVASWLLTVPSKTLWPFYGPILVATVVATRWLV